MIQESHRIFLALLLGHLLADFPFQTAWMVANKAKRLAAVALHAGVQFGLLVASTLIFAHELRVIAVLATCSALAIVHAAQDVFKERLARHRLTRFPASVFLADQALHVLFLAIATLVLTGLGPVELWRSIAASSASRDAILVVAVVYSAFIFGGGYLIRFVTRSLSSEAASATTESPDALRNAGLYIGWLERFLVLTAICVQSPALVGLILTGKSIARFPELKQPKFAEYFLIGTFLSVGLAIVGGLLLLHHFHGTVSLK